MVLLSEGPAAALTVNITRLEVPPPAGFCTLTKAVAGAAISVAGINAVSCVELTNAVVSAVGAPPAIHCAAAPFTKPVPVIEICVLGEPA